MKSIATAVGCSTEQVSTVLNKMKDMTLFVSKSKAVILNLGIG